MSKRSPAAEIKVADGAGGLRPVTDLRFADGSWLIELDVASADAATWMAHLGAEREERGWSSSSISQIEAEENSGSLSVHADSGPSPPSLHVVWEKRRGGILHVRARPGGTPAMSSNLAQDFIDSVDERLRVGETKRAHRWDMFTYRGLAWRGELWLGDEIRLGPPSRFPDALTSPQIVVVDAMVNGIGSSGVTDNFQKLLRELRVFLGVVLGIRPELVRARDGWVADFDERNRPTKCSLRSVGYREVGPPRAFPIKGSCSPVPRETVSRPGIGRTGIWPDQQERWVPDDIEELWDSFHQLPKEKREAFLRAGNAYLSAGPMWPDQRTAYALFHVVACEALKPPGRKHNHLNMYDVVASLAGREEAETLRSLVITPQTVRNKFVHRGELAADELSSGLAQDVFADPSFDEMIHRLSTACQICLIEWLRCGGDYEVVRLK